MVKSLTQLFYAILLLTFYARDATFVSFLPYSGVEILILCLKHTYQQDNRRHSKNSVVWYQLLFFYTIVCNFSSLFLIGFSFSAVFDLSYEFLLLNCVLVLQTIMWSYAINLSVHSIFHSLSCRQDLKFQLVTTTLTTITLMSYQPVPTPEPYGSTHKFQSK